MYGFLLRALPDLNGFLTAGIAITAISLLLYALSFNLKDRVARSFALILSCVVVVFVGETLGSVAQTNTQLEFWLKIQWIGIIFLPATYMQFSDALLATTGRPSRGRRRFAVIATYAISFIFLVALLANRLVGPLVEALPAPHLQRIWLTWVFAAFYAICMLISWFNFWRAYRRTLTKTSRRRMGYLLAGALAPALGSYPYLLFGSGVASQFPLFFWIAVTISNLLVTFLLILMAYAVAFFGVAWPDRVIKRRLLKWLMRGPFTASTVLLITTITRRAAGWYGVDLSALVPVIMVGAILILEHLITLAAPIWERWLFYGKDRADIELLQTIDERLLTFNDLKQFLEALLAAVCDRLQVSKALIAGLSPNGLEILVTIGGANPFINDRVSVDLIQSARQNGSGKELFSWGDHWLVPLYYQDQTNDQLVGLLGFARKSEHVPDEDQLVAINLLAQRAALAIGDRFKQEQVFTSLQAMAPQMEMIQRLRAAARYDSSEILSNPEISLDHADLSPWVKDALTHFWGGPKLAQNPLLSLQIVQDTARENEENTVNALRSILRRAIEDVKPQGERRFTGEWILYNILELKFMEGRKVREIAMRLAMSEADLYRKQRVAIEAVAEAITEMEQQARNDQSSAVFATVSKPIQSTNQNNRGGKFNGGQVSHS